MNYFLSALIITLIIPIWGLLIYLLNRLIYAILKKLTSTNIAIFIVNWLTVPGVIHHELSHALVALFSGAEITEFRPFWPDKETGSLGHVNFIARGAFLLRAFQMPFVSAAPVIMGTVSTILLTAYLKQGVPSAWLIPLTFYLIFSIVIHASMSIDDVKVMLRGIWVQLIAAWVICCYFSFDLMPIFQQVARHIS